MISFQESNNINQSNNINYRHISSCINSLLSQRLPTQCQGFMDSGPGKGVVQTLSIALTYGGSRSDMLCTGKTCQCGENSETKSNCSVKDLWIEPLVVSYWLLLQYQISLTGVIPKWNCKLHTGRAVPRRSRGAHNKIGKLGQKLEHDLGDEWFMLSNISTPKESALKWYGCSDTLFTGERYDHSWVALSWRSRENGVVQNSGWQCHAPALSARGMSLHMTFDQSLSVCCKTSKYAVPGADPIHNGDSIGTS
jgi:hypothetical protein